jgi:hypothetical protein
MKMLVRSIQLEAAGEPVWRSDFKASSGCGGPQNAGNTLW